jgi:hypothetical protein
MGNECGSEILLCLRINNGHLFREQSEDERIGRGQLTSSKPFYLFLFFILINKRVGSIPRFSGDRR